PTPSPCRCTSTRPRWPAARSSCPSAPAPATNGSSARTPRSRPTKPLDLILVGAAEAATQMLTDLFLAIAHHLLVFALAAMLVAEAVLLRGQLDASVL